ncbi:hypothetical protein MMC08_002784 [Hypocenomyce scalaris]|nr:hypothetical protein [Hypocenomyce scalaris]
MLPSSNVIDLEDYQEVPHDQSSYDPEMPSRFMDLDIAIRQRILRLVLIKEDTIMPSYNCGSVMAPDHEVETEDVDLGVLCVCKQLTTEASSILYGENIFEFNKPEVASWWLNRIGSNVCRLRKAEFYLSAGETGPFNVLKERLWLDLFAWFYQVQNLDEIFLSFCQWRTFDEFGCFNMDDFQKGLATHARNMTLNYLEQYRGLKKVVVKGGWTLGQQDCAELIRRMKLMKSW